MVIEKDGVGGFQLLYSYSCVQADTKRGRRVFRTDILDRDLLNVKVHLFYTRLGMTWIGWGFIHGKETFGRYTQVIS